MKLYILRHGEAEARAPSDAERQLTQDGRDQIAALADKAKEKLVGVELILASPYVRAQQTAALMDEVLGLGVQTCEKITPAGSVLGTLQVLEQYSQSEILLVSHQPLVGELVNQLAGKAQGYYTMPTGNLVCLEADPIALGCCDVLWTQR